ncbi:hypothetical protein AYM17_00775 [Coxiella burnetii]|nr:hypothetical protein CbuG_0169 [Coxiella burnetii CbuG_Q212]ACJ19405.1 hypothetical protein CbuK_0082 [Coxiella burnetii CbuK_Q154]ATN66074.1 hypothetical protein AYM17_00775 [Coxiella burnetii]OYK86899.1 hypothetical protein CbuQ229_00845 [Coxiella burnetii]
MIERGQLIVPDFEASQLKAETETCEQAFWGDTEHSPSPIVMKGKDKNNSEIKTVGFILTCFMDSTSQLTYSIITK